MELINTFKKFIVKYGYASFLGGALAAFAGLDVFNWKTWVILVVTAILVEMKVDYEKKEK